MKVTNEAKIGIFVFLVLLGLGGITWKTVGYEFIPQGYSVKAVFKDIDGVELNAPVTLNGLEVGRVDDIHIRYGEATRVELTLWLKEEARLHEGAQAFVKNMGFLGEKYVALSSGRDGTPFLKSGDVIVGDEPADFQNIMTKGESIANNVEKITSQIEERLRINSENIDAILADMRSTMNHLSAVSGNLHERLEANDQVIDQMVQHLNSTSQNLEEMSYDLKKNPWKLLYKPRKKK